MKKPRSIYAVEYLRFRRWFIVGAVCYFISLMALYFFFEAIYDTSLVLSYDRYTLSYDVYKHLAGHYFLLLSPYLVPVMALGLMGRGATRGWKRTDLSMPVGRSSYGGANWILAFKLFFTGMLPVLLFLIIFWQVSRIQLGDLLLDKSDSFYSGYAAVIATEIVSMLYCVIIFSIMSPGLASGFHRGSWGWWLFFLLPLPLVSLVPSFIILPVAYLGIQLAYVIPFVLAVMLLAFWGYMNSRWYFAHKPDL